MLNSRHAIADFIQPTLSGKKADLHLDDALNSYRAASEKLVELEDRFEDKKSLLVQRNSYLKQLLRDEVTAKHEIPSLKKELLELKNSIVNLTFKAQQWAETCKKQEVKIEKISRNKSSLTQSLNATQSKLQTLDDGNLQLETDIKELEDNLAEVTRIRDEISLFDNITPSHQPSPESENLSSTDLVSDVNSSLKIITNNITAKKETTEETQKVSAEINNCQNKIASIESEIQSLESACNENNTVIKGQNENMNELSQQIKALKDRYQSYYDILSESDEISGKRDELIAIVNQENDDLKTALLNCNKLEMTLRLEDLQMTVFLKEMEHLNE